VILGLIIGLALLSRAQLHNARAIAEITAERADLARSSAVVGLDRALTALIHGAPAPESVLLSEGTDRRASQIPADALSSFRGLSGNERALAWSPLSGRLLVASEDGRTLYAPDAGGRGGVPELFLTGAVSSAALSRDGAFVVAATESGDAHVARIDGHEARLLATVVVGAGVTCSSIDGAGTVVAVARGTQVQLYDVAQALQVGAQLALPVPVTRLEFREGALWVLASSGSDVELWRCDPRTGEVRARTTQSRR
jgi:hypothetical protein